MMACRQRRPEHFKKYKKKWNKNNPEKVKIYDNNKRAKRKYAILNTPNKLTSYQWLKIIKKQNSKCFYCKKKTKHPQLEHKIPLSRGGTHDRKNVVASCSKCNYKKHTLTDKEFKKKINARG